MSCLHREDYIVSTKVAGPSAQMEWIRGGPTSLSAKDIQAAVDTSLTRLQLDYVDILHLHWPDRSATLLCPHSHKHADSTLCITLAA